MNNVTDKRIAIVIVNWNGKAHLLRCLNSVGSQTLQPFLTIVVDNGSTDGSVKSIQNIKNLRILLNEFNKGFAKASNAGIRVALDAGCTYIAAINNDAILETTWLEKLVDIMNNQKNIGVCGGKILSYGNKTIIDSAGDYFDPVYANVLNRGKGEVDEGQYSRSEEVLSLCAAGVLFRAEMLLQIAEDRCYFDEDFENYIEDVDLCLRAWISGWVCYYVPEAVMYHVGSATSTQISKIFRHKLAVRNRLLLAVKLFPRKFLLKTLLNVLFPLRPISRYITFRIVPKKRGNRPIFSLSIYQLIRVYFFSIITFVVLLPKMTKKREIIMSSIPMSISKVDELLNRFSSSY